MQVIEIWIAWISLQRSSKKPDLSTSFLGFECLLCILSQCNNCVRYFLLNIEQFYLYIEQFYRHLDIVTYKKFMLRFILCRVMQINKNCRTSSYFDSHFRLNKNLFFWSKYFVHVFCLYIRYHLQLILWFQFSSDCSNVCTMVEYSTVQYGTVQYRVRWSCQ